MTSDEMREAVARVIEPKGWSVRDRHYSEIDYLCGPIDKGILRRWADMYTGDSLAKADAILSMISASPVEEENKRLREALEPAWQPIEAAPETGWGQTIECLLYGLGLGVRTGHIGRLGASRWASIPSLHGNAIADWGATHWMPLPAPPALTNNISTGSPAESETSEGVG